HELHSDPPLLGEIGLDLMQAGGKRIRPRLAILAAKLLETELSHANDVGMAVELLHTASLLHDDLIDESETRRGKITAYRRFGNSVSVMAGDFLLARVLRILARSGEPEFTMLISDVAAKVVEAEVKQLQLADDMEVNEADYFKVIEGKTAELMSAAV